MRIRSFTLQQVYFAATALWAFGHALDVVLFPQVLLSRGGNETLLGHLAAANTLAAALLAVPLVILAERTSRRHLLFAALVTALVAATGRFLDTSPALLLLASALEGITWTALYALVLPILAAGTPPEQRLQVFGWAFAAGVLGEATGSLAAGVLPGLLPAPGYALWAALLAWGLSLPLLLALPELGERHEWSLVGLARIRQAVPLFLLLGLGGGMVVPFTSSYLRTQLGLEPAAIGQVFLVGNLLIAAGGVVAPALAKRFGGKPVMGGTLALLPLGLVLTAFAPSPAGSLLGLAARALAANAISPVVDERVMALAPAASRATAVGILGTLLQLAWGAGSLLAGPLITSRGYQYVFTLAAGIYLLAVPASNLLFHIATSPLPPRRQAPAVQWERLYQPVAALPLMRYLPGVPDDPGERGRWLVAGALG